MGRIGTTAAAHDDGGLQMAHLHLRARAAGARGERRGLAIGRGLGGRGTARCRSRRVGSGVHRIGNILSGALEGAVGAAVSGP
jgi:hypothetical protein